MSARKFAATRLRFGSSLHFLMGLLIATPLLAQAITVPRADDTDRKSILSDIEIDPAIVYTVSALRVFKHKDARKGAIAFLEGDNGAIGSERRLIVKIGNGRWKSVWGEGDGGSSDCVYAIRHYDWALKLIKNYGLKPRAFAPEMLSSLATMRQELKTGGDVHCGGDLEGGITDQ